MRAFLRDPDGHLIELSQADEVRSAALSCKDSQGEVASHYNWNELSQKPLA